MRQVEEVRKIILGKKRKLSQAKKGPVVVSHVPAS
jgi:hypothetical protein